MHPQVIDTTDRSGMRRPGPECSGRVCMAYGCETRLSRYNPSEVCSIHGGYSMGRATGAVAVADLFDLLEDPCLD